MTGKVQQAAVRLERTILAPPDKVYRAWLDPDLLRRWLAPGLEVQHVEVDERVGGHFRVWHAGAGIDAGGFDCEILELVPDRRIVFRWGFVGPERRKGPAYDSLLTITLRELPEGRTALTLVHERLDELAAAMPDVADNVEKGWALVLEQLARLLGEKEIEMRKVIATEWMSLDGVVQAPAYPDEDVSGGFTHGGWHVRYFEDRSMRWVIENVTQAGGYLFGRGTYEMFAAHWPNAARRGQGSAEEQALARALNTLPKYVASRTLKEPLAWSGSTLLGGDAAQAVAELKREDGKYLLAIGSPGLVQSLLASDLIDEVRVMIDPVVLGGGKRLFREDESLKALRLVSSEATSTGAILASYARVAG